MALPEVTNYDPTVYEILITDAVEGYNPSNPNTAANVGISNQAALNLANRTNWLYVNLNNILNGDVVPTGLAPLLSPEFEGTPTAPTPALGDDTTKLSTTAFVQGTVNGLTAVSVAGGSNVTLSAVQAGTGILNFTGALTANIAVILPNTSGKWIVENSTTGPYTLTVKTAAGTGVAVTQGKSQSIYGDGTNIYLSSNDFSNLVLSGQPTTPTPPIGDQSLKIANTDFVWQFVDGAVNVPVGGGSNVTLTPAQYGNGILLLQGALTAAISVQLPSQSGQWIVANQTTGAFGLTMGVTGSAGTKATIPQGQSVIVYSDGTNVILAGAAASSSFSYHTFTATAGQTDFPCSYTPGNIMVIQDGAVLASANYTATDGANVILNTGAPLSDEIQVLAFSSFTVSNAVTWAGGTMLGALQLFGGDTGTTPAQFDNSTKLATTAFVKAAGFQFTAAGGIGFNASQTLSTTQLNGWGQFQTPGTTVTLPSIASTEIGATFTFLGGGAGGLIKGSGSDGIQNSQAIIANQIAINIGQCATVASNGTYWYVVHDGFGNPSFSSSLAANGFQKLPGGLILQWGQAPCANATTSLTTFPVAFPNACLNVLGSGYQATGNTQAYAVINGKTATNFNWTGFFATGGSVPTSAATATVQIWWFAVGY